MNMQAVDSKLLSAVGYDVESQTLAVTFARNGATYHYPGVSAEEHQTLMSADSVGSHFLRVLKPNYEGVRVEAK